MRESVEMPPPAPKGVVEVKTVEMKSKQAVTAGAGA
jgi:hypothetical protein